MTKRHVKALGFFLFKLVGTGLFLWWALSHIADKRTLADAFTLAWQSPGWVVAGIVLAFLSLVASALRWHFLLLAQSIREPFWYIFRLTLYGAFFNIASFGGAAGDAAKIVLLIRRAPHKKPGIALSVMADHVIGFVAGSLIFLTCTWGFGTLDHLRDGASRSTFVAATWFEAGGLIGVVLSVVSCMPGVLAWGRRHFPRLTKNRWVDTITSVIDLFRTRWNYALYSFLVSLVLAATYYLTFYSGLRALGQPVKPVAIMAVMPVVDVIASLPISISGLGVRERSLDFFLHALTGIPTATSVAASLLGFLFNLFWGLIGGLAILTARQSKTKAEPLNADESLHR